MLELLAHLRLQSLGGLRVALFEFAHFRGKGNALAVAAPGRRLPVYHGFHPRRAQPPFGHQPVGGQAPVQRAGGAAILVGYVTANDGPQALNVEIGVLQLQGIESPLHQIGAPGQGVFPLLELQLPPQALVPVVWQHGQHVRVQVEAAFAVAGKAEQEADHLLTVERAKDLPAAAGGHHHDFLGHQLRLGKPPDQLLQLDAPVVLLQIVAGANLDVFRSHESRRQPERF